MTAPVRRETATAPRGGPDLSSPRVPRQRQAQRQQPPTLLPARTDGGPSRSAAGAPRWQRRFLALLVTVDATVAAVTMSVAATVPFGSVGGDAGLPALFSALLPTLFPVLWVLSLKLARAYEPRFLFAGSQEYQRTAVAGVALIAAVAVAALCHGAALDVARGYVVVVLPGTLLLDLVCRRALRGWLHRRRARSASWGHRVLAVGHEGSVAALARWLHRHHHHGMRVVGACLPPHGLTWERLDDHDVPVEVSMEVPVYGRFEDVAGAAARVGADTVVVLPCPELDGTALRRLGWQLERCAVDLVVVPALLDVAGPRTTIRPVDGLPLVHVDHPRFSGGRRLVKEVVDRAGALCALLLLAPLLLAIGVAVRLTSRGPALFRQTRVGRNGVRFTMLKFRSMRADAEERLTELRHANETDGVLFKIREDPRVTGLGRLLRRSSLDELPQLYNVLAGHMSLVGPRPPLPCEVAQYADDVRRRLAVKPGLTGLWQVSGRSDLSWEESVRIDLRYVENWSLALDAAILGRTVRAVARSQGAY